MLKQITFATVLIGLFVSWTAATDHNAGLVVTGAVSGWEYKAATVGSPQYPGDWRPARYIATVQLKVSNEGTQTLIVPYGLGTPMRLRFLDLSNGGNEGFVKPLSDYSVWGLSRRQLDDVPSASETRVIEPGESYVFPMTVGIVVKDSKRKYEPSRYALVGDIEEVRRMLAAKYFSFLFEVSPWEKNKDELRELAQRWRKTGLFPLNDEGKFSIESRPIPSNADWIRKQDLPKITAAH